MATHFPSREVILLFQNIQNLNLEYENRVGRDLVAGTTYTVAQFGGDISDFVPEAILPDIRARFSKGE